MLRFFYDSLDTVKKLRKPTKSDYITMTIAIFVVVIVAGFYFMGADALFSSLYKFFYSFMTA